MEPKYAVISVDATDEFENGGEIDPMLHIVEFYDDLNKALDNYETEKDRISNVYLVQIMRQSINI